GDQSFQTGVPQIREHGRRGSHPPLVSVEESRRLDRPYNQDNPDIPAARQRCRRVARTNLRLSNTSNDREAALRQADGDDAAHVAFSEDGEEACMAADFAPDYQIV